MKGRNYIKFVLLAFAFVPSLSHSQFHTPDGPVDPGGEQKRVIIAAKAADDSDKLDADEKASTDDTIAAFLKKREVEARKPRAQQMQRRLEELEEMVEISEKQKKELQVASKGAVEKSLDPWREQMDNYVRQYLQRAPQEIDMVLASIGDVDFNQSNEEQAAQQSIWETTIKKVLDEQQMATYRQSVKERQEFMFTSVARILVADLDRQIRLTAEQRDAVMTLLEPVVTENLVHLERWANDGHLPVYQLPTLLGGVDPKVLEKVLSERQIEGWNERFANFKGMWDTIQQQKENHQKTKNADKKGAIEVDGGGA